MTVTAKEIRSSDGYERKMGWSEMYTPDVLNANVKGEENAM
jgi:hypothetical protein